MGLLWTGRFKKGNLHPLAKKFTFSLDVDRKLAVYDVRGSLAHAGMLGKIGVLSKKETEAITKGLNKILDELNKKLFKFREDDEDIHTAVERRLIELTGKTGKSFIPAVQGTTRSFWTKSSILRKNCLLSDPG